MCYAFVQSKQLALWILNPSCRDPEGKEGRGPGHPLENCISRSIVVHVEFWYRPPLAAVSGHDGTEQGGSF